MIANDVVFLQPATIDEALAAWREAADAGLRVRYFGGGTELVTGARERAGEFDVLVDLKRIPELGAFDPAARRFGAALRLSDLNDQREVPLLARAAAGVADRTARNSITLGGNLCSSLPYRETALPLLLFDATFTVASPTGAGAGGTGPGGAGPGGSGSGVTGPGGSGSGVTGTDGTRPGVTRAVPARELFAKRMRLAPGEFVVSVELPPAAAQDGYYRRRTRDPRVDYPLVTLCMATVDGELRFAAGGAYGYPVRSTAAEAALAGAVPGDTGDEAARDVAAGAAGPATEAGADDGDASAPPPRSEPARPRGLRARAEALRAQVEAEAAAARVRAEAEAARVQAALARAADPGPSASTPRARAEAAVEAIADRLWDDLRGSAAYRRELLVLALQDGITTLEGT